MNAGIIYYTDNKIEEPIKSVVRDLLLKTKLPIVSCSLNDSINFGNNIVVFGERGYPMMVRQIRDCLSKSEADYVFFCEHDVLYPKSHFDFIPHKDNIFYYNENVRRWLYGSKFFVSYKRMLPLSCLCVNRKFALDHYQRRMEAIEKRKDEFKGREPSLGRIWGYEPGTKKKKRGGFSNDDFETWSSEEPVIDIRHEGTFSPSKVTLKSFKHQPVDWKEEPIESIKGWDLEKLFKL